MKSRIAWTALPPLARLLATVAWRAGTRHRFPSPPFVVAANHQSFLDGPLIAASYGRRIRFVGLTDLFGVNPLLDFALQHLEVIPINRGGVPLGALRAALDHLASGGVVGVFPEGTRYWTFDPDSVRAGAAWLAVRAQVPLVPVAVIGSDRVFGVDNRLHRGRVRIVVGPAMHPCGWGRAVVDSLTEQWKAWMISTLRHS